jgi:hypothetical protein
MMNNTKHIKGEEDEEKKYPLPTSMTRQIIINIIISNLKK